MDEKEERALESEVTELLDADPAEATVDDLAPEAGTEPGNDASSDAPDEGDVDDRALNPDGGEGAGDVGPKRKMKWVLAGLGIVALGAVAIALCTQPLTPGRTAGASGSGPMGSDAGSAPAAVAGPTSDDVKEAISDLSWEGEDVSVDASAAEVEVYGRDVWIRATDSAADAAGSVSRGAKRSAAAAHALAGSGADKVTWTVIGDADGQPMVSIEQDAQSAPAGGEWTDALEGSDGYIISDGAYEAMGGEASGVPQTGGEAPVDHEGNEIVTPPAGTETDETATDADATTEEDGEDSGTASQTGESPASGGSTGSSSSSAKPSGGSSSTKPSGGSSSQGGSSSTKPSGGSSSSKPSGGGSGSQTTTPSKPAHQHSWQPVYRDEAVYETQQVWVPKQEIVRHERYVCRQCGYSAGSVQEMQDHFLSSYMSGGNCGTYLNDSWDEVVDNGHYESQRVQTGTRQVLDHYACSCGATK